MADAQAREKILGAFLTLLAEKRFERIELSEIAKLANVTLADLRGEFGSTFDMIAAFMRETDKKVLSGGEQSKPDPELADQPARDRLFEVLMRRFEALAPYREAVRSLANSARSNPRLALGLNKLAVRSQQWMLSAAGIGSSGLVGGMRAQGLAAMFAQVTMTWLHDEDPGLARTMAALDRQLEKGERLANFMNGLCRFVPGRGPSRHSRRDEQFPADPNAPAAI
ncbi:MAG: TetR/AcrR family transcriptional regulator [Xanthobacteraceae bacterium]|nr:TetR/AcrR family transcriptional regulator [Xanthobacteraceae bacterium]QYK44430.1 MAG: TetR/AcrR family transcriptional regulator [Xanthobacteraceae bacterium]